MATSPSAKRGKTPPAAPPAGSAPAPDKESPAQAFPPRPLKPRPKLLALLAVVFSLWVAFLVALYFRTIYPRRLTSPRPDAKGVVVPDAPAQPVPINPAPSTPGGG